MLTKEIPSHPGYFVTSTGEVISKRFNRPLRVSVGTQGYASVTLSSGNQFSYKTIHRLVADAFILNPTSRPFINHLNGIKVDNRVENLEWVTAAENVRHFSKVTWEIVNTLRWAYALGIQQICLARMFGLNQSTVSRICNYKQWDRLRC